VKGLPSTQRILHEGPAVLRARWHLRSAERLGRAVRVWGTPIVHNYGTLLIGDRVRLVSTVAPIEIGVGSNGTLELGEGTYINYGTSIGATLSIRIGKNCSIGTHSTLIDNDFHSLDPEHRNDTPPSAPIVLEDNVWLGLRVIVLRGVTIGKGSVIGAGSVVTRDIPERCLAAGQPARVIRSV
jgi:acetyltransferase-like isoleucine patch superfamily enzyme